MPQPQTRSFQYPRVWPRRRSRLLSEPVISEAPPPRLVAHRDGLYRRSLAVADVVATGAAIVAIALANDADLGIGLIGALLGLVLINKLSGLYDRDELVLHRSTLDELPSLAQVAGLFVLLACLISPVIVGSGFGRADILLLWLSAFAGMAAARGLVRLSMRRIGAPECCLVVGDPELVQRIEVKMHDSHVNAKVVATVPMDDIEPLLRPARSDAFKALVNRFGVQRVIVAPGGGDTGATLDLVHVAKGAGLRVSVLPRLLEVIGSSVEFDELDGLTMLGVRRFGLSRSSLFVKRSFDVTAAGLGLIAVMPLILAVAIAIKLTSAGPVFFRQKRIGRDGRPFQMIKFRSMVADAEALKDGLRHRNEAQDHFKITDDPRVTRVGRLIRRTSLDELPQLLNVLRGEMSLVGPRPLIEEEDAMVFGYYRSRLHLTPGMTGHWQVLGSSRIPMQEMVTIDYLYVANWSLWTDVKILCRTVAHMFTRRGK